MAAAIFCEEEPVDDSGSVQGDGASSEFQMRSIDCEEIFGECERESSVEVQKEYPAVEGSMQL